MGSATVTLGEPLLADAAGVLLSQKRLPSVLFRSQIIFPAFRVFSGKDRAFTKKSTREIPHFFVSFAMQNNTSDGLLGLIDQAQAGRQRFAEDAFFIGLVQFSQLLHHNEP